MGIFASGVVAEAADAVDPRLAELTPRELEVLLSIAHGSSNAEIATALFLEPSTVKSHLSRAMTKTGARDRVQLVVWAFRHGIVDPAA